MYLYDLRHMPVCMQTTQGRRCAGCYWPWATSVQRPKRELNRYISGLGASWLNSLLLSRMKLVRYILYRLSCRAHISNCALYLFFAMCLIEEIQLKVISWSMAESHIDVILTSGGTGFGPRDRTPEAIRPLLHRLDLHFSFCDLSLPKLLFIYGL